MPLPGICRVSVGGWCEEKPCLESSTLMTISFASSHAFADIGRHDTFQNSLKYVLYVIRVPIKANPEVSAPH